MHIVIFSAVVNAKDLLETTYCKLIIPEIVCRRVKPSFRGMLSRIYPQLKQMLHKHLYTEVKEPQCRRNWIAQNLGIVFLSALELLWLTHLWKVTVHHRLPVLFCTSRATATQPNSKWTLKRKPKWKPKAFKQVPDLGTAIPKKREKSRGCGSKTGRARKWRIGTLAVVRSHWWENMGKAKRRDEENYGGKY